MIVDLRAHRAQLRISQSRLARLSGVSRFKICLYELGEGRLAEDEQVRLERALQSEAQRLQEAIAQLARVTPNPAPSQVGV